MLSARMQRAKARYIDEKPHICTERARIWTESHRHTAGQVTALRRAKAFKETCEQLPVTIFDDELIVGSSGKYKRSAIMTPEFSWQWVDREMDTFADRPQDPYDIDDEQCQFLREQIFPYWQGQSLAETFLARVPADTAKILVDTGIIDNDSKWRQAVGEITPDYQDVLFKKGYRGIIAEARQKIDDLSPLSAEAVDKIDFYQSQIIVAEGIIVLANRYAKALKDMAEAEADQDRRLELLAMSAVCRHVPEYPPSSFHEAIQFVWFVQLGGILSENPLALNLGRFDQYIYPYYQRDLDNGLIAVDGAQELIDALWLKLSEWVWTISANTADFFAGYNQFQNLTIGGKKRDGSDATNDISYMALKATKRLKSHQPGLSCRIHANCPPEFMMAVLDLVGDGTGFPAIHSDSAGREMLLQAGYDADDARDWSNCGCVVPHFRKTGQWTAAVNINFGSALEYALNGGCARSDGEQYGLPERPIDAFNDYQDIEDAYLKQLSYLIKHAVIGTVLAQQLHGDMVPRPFLSTTVDGCMEKGLDLSRGGAKYNVGPVLTGIGLASVANSLAVIKALVFDEQTVSLSELGAALAVNWQGHESLRRRAQAVVKYGNDEAYVDDIAIKLANAYYHEVRQYKDIFDSPFNSAFMGISNYIPAGKVVGATPCGRKAGQPLTEGVSPYVGSDTSSPLAAMKSSAKLNHDLHSGGTLLNLRLAKSMFSNQRSKYQLASMIHSYFNMGAFHVQFNVVDTALLKSAQREPQNYRDLLVRVAGYSTQFVNLSKEVQDAIIARTEHDELS